MTGGSRHRDRYRRHAAARRAVREQRHSGARRGADGCHRRAVRRHGPDRHADRTGWSAAGARAEIRGIGLSLAGPIDTETAMVTRIPTLPGWDGFPVGHALAERTGIPVHVENDAIAATLGEWRHGAGRGVQQHRLSDGQHRHRWRRGGRRQTSSRAQGNSRASRPYAHGAGRPTCPCGTGWLFRGTGVRIGAVVTGRSTTATGIGLSDIPDIDAARDVFEGARAGDSPASTCCRTRRGHVSRTGHHLGHPYLQPGPRDHGRRGVERFRPSGRASTRSSAATPCRPSGTCRSSSVPPLAMIQACSGRPAW